MSNNLKEYLDECKESYYAGEPIISDEQYDHIEELYERISGEVTSVGTNRGRTPHWYPMYSLRKVYNDEERLPHWGGRTVIITPKLDGAAIAFRYVNGNLDSVVTRGDGKFGENITHLFNDKVLEALGMPSIILHDEPVQITGEIVAPKHIDNARNYAAGALNLKDIEQFEIKTENLDFFVYDINPKPTEFYSTDMRYINELGFTPLWSEKDFSNYPTDGEVHRVDHNPTYFNLGFTSKHPRGAFALKERSEGVKTKILDVVWQTGKSGIVSPVAILEPIEIDGATVSRATLNNFGFIEALGVRIGDSVMVERAGGIIPRIIRKAE